MPTNGLENPHQRILIWVHSGGTDPTTGEPTFATLQRLEKAFDLRRNYLANGTASALLISGDETRKSGPGNQGGKITDYIRKEYPDINCLVSYGGPCDRAYLWVVDKFPPHFKVVFVNDETYLPYYKMLFLHLNPVAGERIEFIGVPSLTVRREYLTHYPLAYQAAMLSLMMLRLTLRMIGKKQFLLFGLDRWINKATRNPAKRAILWLVNRILRADLR